MAFVKKTTNSIVGQTVKLTQIKESLSGYFEIGSIVKITDVDGLRGYTFEDTEGNIIIDAGFDGFEIIDK